jgi:uncharacterized protein
MAGPDQNVATPRHAGPERTCVACRGRFPQEDLVRVTLSTDGQLPVGRLAPGRGAYVCASTACVALLTRKRPLGRALRANVAPEAVAALVAEIVFRTPEFPSSVVTAIKNVEAARGDTATATARAIA